MQSARRALIAGLGLIGGSIGMALRRRGWHVSFVDPNVTEQEAQAAGAADERLPDGLKPVLHLCVLATPVDVALTYDGRSNWHFRLSGFNAFNQLYFRANISDTNGKLISVMPLARWEFSFHKDFR